MLILTSRFCLNTRICRIYLQFFAYIRVVVKPHEHPLIVCFANNIYLLACFVYFCQNYFVKVLSYYLLYVNAEVIVHCYKLCEHDLMFCPLALSGKIKWPNYYTFRLIMRLTAVYKLPWSRIVMDLCFSCKSFRLIYIILSNNSILQLKSEKYIVIPYKYRNRRELLKVIYMCWYTRH